MKKPHLKFALVPAIAAAAIALTAPQTALAQNEDEAETTEMTQGEKRLAKMLEGRVAGEPQACIRQLPIDQARVIDRTAIVYGRGKTIYVQRTQDPSDIRRNRTMVLRRFDATQLCRQDVVTTVDPVLGFFLGNLFFDDFVPYTRVDEDNG